jgi:hypothetical protein
MNPQSMKERLEAALETLKGIDLPENLQVVAFERLLDAHGLPRVERSTLTGELTKDSAGGEASGDLEVAEANGLLAAIATQFRTSIESVGHVYEVRDGSIELILRRDMLPEPSKKAVSMRQVGLLVVAGRQAAGLEEWTPMSTLREECEEIGVLDSTNFSTEIGKLGFKVEGAGAKREIRATRHHFAEASDLLTQILDRSS